MTDVNAAAVGRQRVRPGLSGDEVRAPQVVDPKDPQQRKGFDQERAKRKAQKKRGK